MLTSHATGQQGDAAQYVETRELLINDAQLRTKVPQFLRTCRSLADFWSFIKGKFAHYAERREFLRTEFDSLLTYLEESHPTPSDATVLNLRSVTASTVEDAWKKALDRRQTDPEGAITAARTLLETVCKHLLDAQSIPYDDTADLPKLYALIADKLNLAPSQHSEKDLKRILGGCHSVVEGLGALRNRLGDAHGKGTRAVKPAPRHAALAVNLAGTMATFLLATWEARQPK